MICQAFFNELPDFFNELPDFFTLGAAAAVAAAVGVGKKKKPLVITSGQTNRYEERK